MKKITLLALLCILLCSVQTLSAGKRSDAVKPKWLTASVPESMSNSYFFVRAYGKGLSVAAAKQDAFANMSQRLEAERKLTIDTYSKVSEVIVQNTDESASEYRQEIIVEATEKGRKIKITCREIDDYWTCNNGVYEMHVLYTVSNNTYGGSYEDEIIITTEYGAKAGFMSIIPSVGQFYKGSTTKGSIILASEILAAGGIILCENNRASYIKKMHEQPKYASEYNSLANTWETNRNICIGAAAAIYAYNLIDAFVAKGAKRVVIKKSNATFSAMPYIDANSMGVSLALQF